MSKNQFPFPAPNPTQSMVDVLMASPNDLVSEAAPKQVDIKFKHFRFEEFPTKETTILPQGGVTLAYTRECLPKQQEGLSKFVYAMAWCHYNDNYNKRVGRAIASGRLIGRHSADWKQEIYCQTLDEFFEHIAEDIEEEYLSMGTPIEDINIIY